MFATKELIDDIYYKLETECKGKKNAKSRNEIANWFGLSERELRHITRYINMSADYEGIVSATHAMYICDDETEIKEAVRATYSMGVSLLQKAFIMEKKANLRGQVKIDLDSEMLERIIGDNE